MLLEEKVPESIGVAPTGAQSATPSKVSVLAAASPVPSAAADLLTPLQKDLVDAYLRYWDIRMRAYYDLDPSRLHEVMAGEELAREERQVLDLKGQGRAVSMDVEHNIRILKATPEEAVVYDEYVNHSLYV